MTLRGGQEDRPLASERTAFYGSGMAESVHEQPALRYLGLFVQRLGAYRQFHRFCWGLPGGSIEAQFESRVAHADGKGLRTGLARRVRDIGVYGEDENGIVGGWDL